MSQQQLNMVAEHSVPISKRFSGDNVNYAKFKDRVRQDAVKAGLDVHSIHKQPKMVDYVTDPAKQIAGYKGALLTQEQMDDGVVQGDVILGFKARKAYEDASKEYRVNKAKYYGIIKRNIKEGSAAWNATRRFDENCDSESLLKHFDVTYKSNTISAILRYAEEYRESYAIYD